MKTFEELEEFLNEALGETLPNFSIETLEDGHIVIFTGLTDDPDGEGLVDVEDYDASIDDNLEEDND